MDLLNKEFEKIEKLSKTTNNFFYDKETAIALNKEIQDDITDIRNSKTPAYAKVELSMKWLNLKTRHDLDNIINFEEIKNEYDRFVFNIQECSDKLQKVKFKLKKFFLEIFNEKDKPKDILIDKEIENNPQIIKMLKKQNTLKQLHIFAWIFNLIIYTIIFLLLFFRFKNENKKNNL